MWKPGETFNDDANNIQIRVDAATAAGFRITVTNQDAFYRTWGRTDKPVSDLDVTRTWMWGPESFTGSIEEPYLESAMTRAVRYYDKSRMEITYPDGDPTSTWFVTNGLLVMELVTGQLQVGDAAFDAREPAQVNVAGDANDTDGPTYATIATLRARPPLADGSPVAQRIDRAGTVTNDPTLAQYGVTAAQRVTVPGIDHQVASVFWEFMNSSGRVWIDGVMQDEALFENPYYATGYPIAEAYWARVRVGGVAQDVLMQCFERRCLTYTPGNPDGWKVEAGNVGRHYYEWRYRQPEFEGRIVFASDRGSGYDIFAVDETTEYNQPRQLTTSGGNDVAPASSPDGTWIAFVSDRDGPRDIFVMSSDGENVTKLTSGMDADQPAWSPDGSRIAFVATDGNDSDIFVMDADGSDMTQLTSNDAPDVDPVWSPDGSSIVFSSWRDESFDLYAMSNQGGNVVRLTDTSDTDERNPTTSPDGEHIAFERYGMNGNAEIFLTRLDGSDERNLSQDPGWDGEADFSPDGSRVVFVSSRFDGLSELYMVDLDGTNLVNLTNHPDSDVQPDWGT
jgi:hypothetical protein